MSGNLFFSPTSSLAVHSACVYMCVCTRGAVRINILNIEIVKTATHSAGLTRFGSAVFHLCVFLD